MSDQVMTALIVLPLYTYLVARLGAAGYFHAKMIYHSKVVKELSRGEVNG